MPQTSSPCIFFRCTFPSSDMYISLSLSNKRHSATSSTFFVLHALAVRPLTTRPREDGALLPLGRSPMANRSFLLCQRWFKNVPEYICPLSISRPALSTHFLHASVQLPSSPGHSMPQTSPCIFLLLFHRSHAHFPLLLV
ncbi:unnamed protein product [Ectocarpus sp. 12 AP-2014]